MFRYLSAFLLTLTILSAQEIDIVEIIDANLFRTEDSTLISMVDLEVPSIKDEDSSRITIAEKAIKLAKINLLSKNLRFEETYKKSCSGNDARQGHLFRIYPLSEQSINQLYLEKGYAVYVPCDTSYLDIYREAGISSMNSNRGVWGQYIQNNPDIFNRFRFSFLLIEEYLENDAFPPLFGLNYRWSDLLSIVDEDAFHLNVSAETGTLVYVFLPYLNIGSEIRYKNFYGRFHYDGMIPFYFLNGYGPESFNFWGFDIGFIIDLKNNKGIEIEFNSKRKDDDYINFISISFASY